MPGVSGKMDGEKLGPVVAVGVAGNGKECTLVIFQLSTKLEDVKAVFSN